MPPNKANVLELRYTVQHKRIQKHRVSFFSPPSSGDSGDIAVAACTFFGCVHPTLNTRKAAIKCIQVVASRLMVDTK